MIEHREVPRVGVGCIIAHQGRLLLVRSRRRGLWSTPGGNLDFGESPAEGAIRESYEEAGVRVQNVEFVAITNDVLPDSGRHYLTIWMRGVVNGPELDIVDVDEIDEAGWFDLDALPGPRHLYFENFLNGLSMPRIGLTDLVADARFDVDT